jgi:hypothetical protein
MNAAETWGETQQDSTGRLTTGHDGPGLNCWVNIPMTCVVTIGISPELGQIF